MFYQVNIVEYDISAAGPNCMYAEGYLPKDVYERIMSLPKQSRNVQLGYYLKDHGLQKERKESIDKYINKFIEDNDIKEENILEIASDAIWIKCQTEPAITEYGNVKFRRDREATSLFRFKDNNFYFDSWSGTFYVRGYNEENEFTREMRRLMSILENNNKQPEIYRQVHKIRRLILKDGIIYKTKNVSKNLIDHMIDVLIY